MMGSEFLRDRSRGRVGKAARTRRHGRRRHAISLERLEDRQLLTALDPAAFTSLGTLDAVGGTYTIDSDALTLTGPNSTSFTGVLSGGIAVFDFTGVTVESTGVIVATGSHPVAILSQGSLTVDGTIDANGQSGTPTPSPTPVSGGPGGGAGGEWASSTQQPGGGPGGGGAVSGAASGSNYGGGGGGFGGAGGTGGASGGAGGSTYGDLLTQLQGGSGGASGIGIDASGSYASSGGGGGGALEIGAENAITIDASGIVEANGGAGAGSGFGASGGGSGGGVFLHAPTITNDGAVSADGGAGGDGGCCGGGGGGGGGLLDFLYSTDNGTGTYTATGGAAGSNGTGTASTAGSAGIITYQSNNLITVGLSGSEILLSGKSGVTSLGVVYDPASETYTFTADAGATFGADGSLPAMVVLTPNGNTATLAPATGDTWSGLGYSVGTDLTATTGAAVTLGGPGAPASNFGTAFDVATSGGGVAGLAVDDSADGSSQTVAVTGPSLTIGSTPAITYGGATLTGLTFDGGATVADTVDVITMPTLANGASMSLVMGSSTTNAIYLGDSGDAASALSNVVISGTSGLTVNDSHSTSNNLWTISTSGVSEMTGPTFAYSTTVGGSTTYADIQGLTFDSGTGAVPVDVTSSPPAGAGLSHIALNMGTSTGDAVTLGGPGAAASSLGSVNLSGTTGLSIDDSADATAGTTFYFDSGVMKINSTQELDYSGATLTSATFAAGSAGTTVTVHRPPAGLPAATAMVLNMGTSTNNAVSLGQSEADQLGDVTVTGHMGLTVDDSNGSGSWTIGATATTISFSNGTTSNVFDYSGATLSTLSLKTNNSGGNTVNVTGMPTLPAGTAMSIGAFSGSGDAFNLGDTTHAASTLGGIDLSPPGDGTATLTIDDEAGASNGTATVGSSSVVFNGGPTFSYDNQKIAGLTLDASNAGRATVDVQGSPASASGLAPITLAMGTGASNIVNLGDQADALGDVTVTTGAGGTTDLFINDSTGVASTIGMTESQVSFTGGPTFTYGAASLAAMSLTASGVAGNTVDIAGTPTLTGGLPMAIATSANGPMTVNLGDGTHAASVLGSVNFMDDSTSPIALTVDDAAGDGSVTIGVASSGMTFGGGGPTFNYTGDYLSGLTLEAANAGTDLVNVTGSPVAASGLASITLDMGSGTGNGVTLGGASAPASSLGNVSLTTTNPGRVALTVDNSADTIGQAMNVSFSDLKFGTSGPDFNYSPAVVALSSLTIDASDQGSNTMDVGSTPLGAAFTLNMGSGTGNAITLGGSKYAADQLNGNVTITTSGTAPNIGSTSLTIDDTSDPTGQTIGVTATNINLNGLTFAYSGAHLAGLTLDAGSGADTVNVTGSPASASGLAPITLNMGAATNNAVNLGGPSNAASALGSVTVTGTTGLSINDSTDATSRTPTLIYDATSHLSDLTGIGSSTFAFGGGVSRASLLPSAQTGVTTSLAVDFSQGNPLPAGSSSNFTFGTLLNSGNTLTLQGELPGSPPFDSETYAPTANQPGSGSISFVAGGTTTTLDFGGLAPITDTVPTTTFLISPPSNAGVVNLLDGPIVGASTQTDTVSSGDTPSAFELINFANKTDVTLDLTNLVNPSYVPPPSIPATGLSNLTVKYFKLYATGHTLVVNQTTPGITSTIQLGGYNNTVSIQGVTAGGPLVVDDTPTGIGETNSVLVGDSGSLANIQAGVTINGGPNSTVVTLDGSASTSGFGHMLLERNGGGTQAQLSNILPSGTFSYDPAIVHAFNLNTGTGADSLTVDFANGDPFLGGGAAPYTLSYNGGGGGDSLNFQDSNPHGNVFSSETYAASGPGSGIVSFYNGVYQGGVRFSNLTPTTDSVPVMNYTFVPPTSGGTIAVTDAPTSLFALISDPSPSPSFESVAYEFKTNVTIDATGSSNNNHFILNNPSAEAIQQSLTFKLGSGDDTFDIQKSPGYSVGLAIDGGTGSATYTVNGSGLATGTSPSFFSIVGGAGPNTLRLNDQGVGGPVTLQPATGSSPAIAHLGSSDSLAFANMGTIQVYQTNNAPSLTIPGTVSTIPAQPGVPMVDVPVATFTDADLGENASSYQAVINWGDSTPATAGTITANPTTPGQYIVSGSHAYRAAGDPRITITLLDLGGTFPSTFVNAGGIVAPVTTQLDAIGAVGGEVTSVSAVAPAPTDPSAPSPVAPTLISGRLSPQSDSGLSNSDGITNVTMPTFVGAATPGAVIQVFARPAGSTAAPVLIATGVADGSGAWSATVTGSPLAQGSYQVAATATDAGGSTSTSLGSVVIDTDAPVITNIVLDRRRGQIDVYFQDNLSGMALTNLSNGADYQVSASPLNNQVRVRRALISTGVEVIPAASPAGVAEAIVTLNRGKLLPGGHYTVQVTAAGVTDVAGNVLNGRYDGSYPSGNTDLGGNYVGQIMAYPRRTLRAVPIGIGHARPRSVAALRAEALARPRHVAAVRAVPNQGADRASDRLVDQAIASLVGHGPGRRGH